MDRMLYIAGSGATQTLAQQASIANNMANVSTTGFRAQLNSYRAVPVVGDEMPTRSFVSSVTPGADMSAGTITSTGRNLDIAVQGDGWLAVQAPDGTEAYTRAGSLQVAADGQVMTMDRLPVVGSRGPLVVPPGSTVAISQDGNVTAIGQGDPITGISPVGKLKLVKPDNTMLTRGDDGMFRTKDGSVLDDDPTVSIQSGALEGSNVNPISVLVDMITNARGFEMQMKNVSTADTDDQNANQLLTLS
jgi:flagellar basal-body rod protein FlgF